MGKLGEWAEKNRTYLKIEPGETVTVLFLGYKIVTSRFDPDEETIQYSLEVGGDPKVFESRSLALADAFDGVEKGSLVNITREGKGPKTKYTIEPYEKAEEGEVGSDKLDGGDDGAPPPVEMEDEG